MTSDILLVYIQDIPITKGICKLLNYQEREALTEVDDYARRTHHGNNSDGVYSANRLEDLVGVISEKGTGKCAVILTTDRLLEFATLQLREYGFRSVNYRVMKAQRGLLFKDDITVYFFTIRSRRRNDLAGQTFDHFFIGWF